MFDEAGFFRALEASETRALLVGRRAMIALGVPVEAADYDLWVDVEDVEKLNEVARHVDLLPSREPAAAREHGRYVLQSAERMAVLVSRRVTTKDDPPQRVHFNDVWQHRQIIEYAPGVHVGVPRVEDLRLTQRFGRRRKDLVDIPPG